MGQKCINKRTFNETHIGMNRMIKNKPILLLDVADYVYSASNKICFDCIIYENEFEEKIDSMSDNVFIFLISGTLSLAINGGCRHTFDHSEIILVPRYSSCHLLVTRYTKLVTVRFREVTDKYGQTLLKLVKAECPVLSETFPCLPMNPVLLEYIGEVCRFASNPQNKQCRYEVSEEEFFMVFGVYYTKRELSRLFSPILMNPGLIR